MKWRCIGRKAKGRDISGINSKHSCFLARFCASVCRNCFHCSCQGVIAKLLIKNFTQVARSHENKDLKCLIYFCKFSAKVSFRMIAAIASKTRLRWIPHNIRAIMAKIKLLEKPRGMLLVWIQLIRNSRDLSSQADHAGKIELEVVHISLKRDVSFQLKTQQRTL